MRKDFDIWNQSKKAIDGQVVSKFIKEREVWWCALGINIGDEENGKNKSFERPVLVIKKFNKDLVLGIPLSTNMKDSRYYFPITDVENSSSALISQIRAISTKRFLRRGWKLSENQFSELKKYVIQILFSDMIEPPLSQAGASGA